MCLLSVACEVFKRGIDLSFVLYTSVQLTKKVLSGILLLPGQFKWGVNLEIYFHVPTAEIQYPHDKFFFIVKT